MQTKPTSADAPLDMAPLPGPGTRLAHLSGPGSAIRQVIAAHYLTTCDTVVEIGGAGLPLTGFLTHAPSRVVVIDPKIDPFHATTLKGRPCRIDHIASKVQEVALDLAPGYGLALLGLSLKPFGRRPAIDPTLRALMAGAGRVVVDYAMRLDRAVGQVTPLLAEAGLTTMFQITFRIEDGSIEASDYADRRLIVLDRPARGA